jgi:hypothetical protein
MGADITPVVALAFTGVLLMIVFAFVSVVIWTEARRKEREALYRAELLKKLAETPGPGADAVLASLREEDQRRHGRRREFVTLGGLLCLALGLAVLMAVGMSHSHDNSGYVLAFVPMFLGVALIGHARLVMGRAAKST